MNFFKILGNSIHSPKFYANLPKKSFKTGLGYFLILILLLTAVHLITLINPLLVTFPKEVNNIAYELTGCFPQDLEVKVTNGQVSINKEQPYFISTCTGGGYLAVIDTKTDYSPQKFESYRVGAWVTKNSIVYKRNDLETRTYSLEGIKDFKLNKTEINSFQNKLEPYLKFVGPIVFIAAFVGIYLLYIFRLFHLLIIALLIWLLGKIFKHQLNFGSSYKVGLYAITLGLIVDLVVNLTSRWTNFHGFPFMVTILTLAVVFVNLFQSKKSN